MAEKIILDCEILVNDLIHCIIYERANNETLNERGEDMYNTSYEYQLFCETDDGCTCKTQQSQLAVGWKQRSFRWLETKARGILAASYCLLFKCHTWKPLTNRIGALSLIHI